MKEEPKEKVIILQYVEEEGQGHFIEEVNEDEGFLCWMGQVERYPPLQDMRKRKF